MNLLFPLPVWGAEMFPTDVLHRTVPDVSQTSLGLHWCEVGHSGGCSSFFWRAAHNQGLRSAISMRADTELLPFFFLLSHAFLSQRPLKASANYRIHTSPPLLTAAQL